MIRFLRHLSLWAVFLAALPASGFAQTVHVLPYLQPGDGRTLEGTDVKVIRWLTDQKPGDFTVEYQVGAGGMKTVFPARTALDFEPMKAVVKKDTVKPKDDDDDDDEPDKKKDVKDGKDAKDGKDSKDGKDVKEAKPPPIPEMEQHYYRYTAHLRELPFNSEVHYRVKLAGQVIREATFHTRPSADRSVRCVLVGDMAQGRKVQNEVAYQISRQKPEFLVALGDIVYPAGRVSQYMAYYWKTYNGSAAASPASGAPLMATTTFYPVLGNHDVSAKLSTTPDALGAYYFFAPPQGGPGRGPWATQIDGDLARQTRFLVATQECYPSMDTYSFDYGPAHFVVLNDNPTMKIESPDFLRWLKSDLQGTKAKWKFVCFHMPGFQSAKQHYTEQQIRPLSPLFEECGVDITFAGHVHNYQRGVPLRFLPEPKQERKKGKIEGKFTLDTEFDGVTKTTPAGIIHMVAGGGGATLYAPGVEKTAEGLRKLHGANYADFTAKMVVDKHSFVSLDIAPDRLQLRAISNTGEELDAITITKRK